MRPAEAVLTDPRRMSGPASRIRVTLTYRNNWSAENPHTSMNAVLANEWELEELMSAWAGNAQARWVGRFACIGDLGRISAITHAPPSEGKVK